MLGGFNNNFLKQITVRSRPLPCKTSQPPLKIEGKTQNSSIKVLTAPITEKPLNTLPLKNVSGRLGSLLAKPARGDLFKLLNLPT
jgi:hypothetical protein